MNYVTIQFLLINLQGASISVAGENRSISAEYTDVIFDWTDADASVLYGESGHNRINTEFENVTLSSDMYLSPSDFVCYKGADKGNMSISEVEGMPDYFDAIFEAPSQGWYVTNDTFVPGIEQSVSITIEDVQAFIKKNGQWTSYDMANACYVNKDLGVQFQTSSSCPGPWPLKLRMKVKMQFQPK